MFLLAETEEDLQRAGEMLRRYSRGIRLAGSGIMETDDKREESVVNEINGTETDCILSVLASPYQEQFISRNKALLNAKIWLGCGSVFSESRGGHKRRADCVIFSGSSCSPGAWKREVKGIKALVNNV